MFAHYYSILLHTTQVHALTLVCDQVEEQKVTPLSPKKATQVATASQSEDELATTEKTPLKPLMRSPMKPPGSIFGTAKKLDFSSSITVNRAMTQDMSGSVMASPARRPPQSPFKESMKASPQVRTSPCLMFIVYLFLSSSKVKC